MHKRIILGFVLVLIFASAATGVEIAWQIYGLEGEYIPSFMPYNPQPFQRSTTFDATMLPPFTVNGISLRIVGSVTINESYCNPPLSDPFLSPFSFAAEIPDSMTGGIWHANSDAFIQNGAFDVTVPITTETGATWEFFEAARLLYIYLNGHGCPGCMELYYGCSEAFVNETYLILDLEFVTSGHESTWGAIKALY